MSIVMVIMSTSGRLGILICNLNILGLIFNVNVNVWMINAAILLVIAQ